MRYILIITLAILSIPAIAQDEKSDIRRGNDLFKQGKYPEAETAYKQAIGKNTTTYEGAFNLGGALYKQQRWEEAAAGFQNLTKDNSNPNRQSQAFYNLANAMLKTRKIDEAIENYKNALRLNPSDMQAKFNLAYAQKLKQEQDKQNDQNKDNKDNQQNQDQNKDNKDQNKDNQDNKDNKDNKDQNKDNKDNKNDKQQPPPQQKPSPQSEQMLKAVQAAEDKTKEKVDKKEAEAVGAGAGKQW